MHVQLVAHFAQRLHVALLRVRPSAPGDVHVCVQFALAPAVGRGEFGERQMPQAHTFIWESQLALCASMHPATHVSTFVDRHTSRC